VSIAICHKIILHVGEKIEALVDMMSWYDDRRVWFDYFKSCQYPSRCQSVRIMGFLLCDGSIVSGDRVDDVF